MDEEVQPSSGYYLQPVDNAGVRDSKRYVQSPLQTPTSDTEEPPQFGDLEGDGKRCVFYAIPLHEKFLQFDWLTAVVFQLNLKYVYVKITNLLPVVV